ncbi:uncharacterized protein LOC110687459 [Chenopodium quinoa]|uniref:uncharacterized protein LOC110687459 n=1 Tax=Chenopodium quinoa TaxID=63459 RepID=UPI000B78063D|nr:uncharacterized protein LOC110687459 [Chenopodium quinoa]
MVADAFSNMNHAQVACKSIHGAKANRSGPEIPHPLFLDDSLLFTRANRQECQEIVVILNKYEAVTGQKINYEKDVSVSRGVSTDRKRELIDILSMKEVKKHEKYLVIPAICGRSKSVTFGALTDRVWKKLHGRKEKLLSKAGKEILLKEHSINPWLVDEGGRFIVSDILDELQQVSDIIDHVRHEWRLDLLAEHFNERDQRCILSIPLSVRAPKDVLMWAFSKEGTYNVKSAYMLGKGCNLDNFHNAWVKIWSLDVSSKIQNFLWRVCTNTLPTRSDLVRRHMIESPACSWCNRDTESTLHALYNCSRVKHLGAILAWCVWTERNKKIFNNKFTPNLVIMDRVERLEDDQGKYAKCIYQRPGIKRVQQQRAWSAPPPGVVKINSDACLSTEGNVGLGVVARNEGGDVIFTAIRRSNAWWKPVIAKAKGIVMALRLGKKYGLRDVVVESDCEVIVHRLQK